MSSLESSNATDPVLRMKRLATQLVWYDRTTVERRPDGSIVITPHPRQLPNEILMLILGHLADDLDTLYTSLFVTKQFSPIATSLLWQAPNLRSFRSWRCFIGSLQAASPEWRSILGQYVRRLKLDGYWSDNDVKSLFPYIPLDYITQTELLAPAPIQQLARHLQYLTTLYIRVPDLTETDVVAIGQHCPYLTDLEWYVVLDQMPVWLKHLSCPLERLVLVSYIEAIDQEALTIIQGMDQLRCLELYQMQAEPLTQLLGPYWPHLTKLRLAPCHTIAEHIWIEFFTSHLDLESLDLDLIDTWTSLPSLPRLTHLSLSGNAIITSNDLRRYIQHSPQLASVRIWLCERMVAENLSVGTEYDGAIRLDKSVIESIRESIIDCS